MDVMDALFLFFNLIVMLPFIANEYAKENGTGYGLTALVAGGLLAIVCTGVFAYRKLRQVGN
jgi:hypothetical protein